MASIKQRLPLNKGFHSTRKKVEYIYFSWASQCLFLENLCDRYLYLTNIRSYLIYYPLSPVLIVRDSFLGRNKERWIQTRSGIAFDLKGVVMSIMELEYCYKPNTTVQDWKSRLEQKAKELLISYKVVPQL